MIHELESPYKEEDILASLHPITQKWFLKRFGAFSPPQLYSILHIKKRLNILISSPTGSGKTLSAFLAVLDTLLRKSIDGTLTDETVCVYVSPLKALSNDIEKNLLQPLEELEELAGKPLGIRVGVRTGDTTPYERQKMRKNPPHILITTPESLSILHASKIGSEHLKNTEYVIIDEIHALADNKRGTHLSLVLERFENSPVRIGLSATVAPLPEVAELLVGSHRNCDYIDVQYKKSVDITVQSPVKNLIACTHEELLQAQYTLIHSLVQEHRSTLIFTNTRAATERVVHNLKTRYPRAYSDTLDAIDDESDEQGEVRTSIAAHHGSLSKEHRQHVEQQLRDGTLRCVVSSTSLELGIDIGYVDLVILLGSPKSVARALQRIGRSGHKLNATAKGRIVVTDRDDLVECTVLARESLKRHIDRIHIPRNCLDVLSQEIYAQAIAQKWNARDLYRHITQAYPYKELSFSEFLSVVKYLAGEHAPLEERHVYAKIWYDEDTQMIGRRGRMARVLYSTNTGTIPDQAGVIVKIGEHPIGSVSEPFLEGLKKGDVFVLGGEAYQFKYARGMTAQVQVAHGKRPTVPSWFSEMLPLSRDLSEHIRTFRGHLKQLFRQNKGRKDIVSWILSYAPVDIDAANSIYEYAKQQHLYSEIPDNSTLVIEYYQDRGVKHTVVHTLYGRRVNDVLSRAVALVLAKTGSGDVEISLNDNGFILRCRKPVQVARAIRLLHAHELDKVMHTALQNTEVIRRRFRHCAARALMILRQYKGNRKSAGRQQVSSKLLLAAIRRIGLDFPIYKEAEREVLEDKMDIEGTKELLEGLEHKRITVVEKHLDLPSPFGFLLALQGYADVMRAEDRKEFIRRLHREVLAKLSTKQSKADMEDLLLPENFSYDSHWSSQDKQQKQHREDVILERKEALFAVTKETAIPAHHIFALHRIIEGETKGYSSRFIVWLGKALEDNMFPADLQQFFQESLSEISWR